MDSQHSHLQKLENSQGIEQEAKHEQAAEAAEFAEAEVAEAEVAEVARRQKLREKKLESSFTRHTLEMYSFLDCFMLENTCNALCAKQ